MARSQPVSPPDADEPPWVRRIAIALIGVTIVVGWGPRLFWGLGLDETFSVWQVDSGLGAIARDKLGNPGQSVLFAYIEALFYFPSSRHMEVWLRVPSLMGALLSCVLVHRLAALLVARRVALVAVIALVGSPQMIIYSTQARPYALAVAACLAALWGLLRFLDGGRRLHGLCFAVSMAAAIHLHFMFVLFAIVPAFLVLRRVQREPGRAWRGLLGWCGLTVLLVLPLAPMARTLSRRTDLAFQPMPGFAQLGAACLPVVILTSLIAFLVLFVRDRRNALAGLQGSSVRPVRELAILWLLAPPLALFVGSYVFGQSMLIERYCLHTVAAEALLVATLFRAFSPRVAKLALLAGSVPLAAYQGIQAWSLRDSPTGWRRPLQTIAATDPGAAAAVFLQAGHPMSNGMDWEHALPARSFLYSPIAAYPVPNRVYPLPYDADEKMRAYVRRLADTELRAAPTIFLVGVIQHPTNEWIRMFFESRGYASTYAVPQGICLVVMRKVAPDPPPITPAHTELGTARPAIGL